MRTIRGLLFLVVLLSPVCASAQSVEVYGSVGPTITDTGNSVAAGVGFAVHPRVTIAGSFERTHISTRTTRFDDGVSHFRGGTLYLGSAEVRFVPLGRDRWGPYGLAGLAAGISRPNVNQIFTNRITNQVRAAFVGGGVQVPVGERLAVFADARMMVGGEGIEGIVAVAPVRAGVALRF